MAHYILNTATAAGLHAGFWTVDEGEPHRDALAAGDLVLVYLAAPAREFVARAELASFAPGGVVLGEIVEWDPPVPMNIVLERLNSPATAKADFDVGVVRITEREYETVLALAAERA